jgi:hypothetical protein
VSAPATLIRYLIAYHSGDISEQQSAEKFLLKMHPASPEAAMLLSSDFSQSEAEKLRQSFKASLIGQSFVSKVDSTQPKVKKRLPTSKTRGGQENIHRASEETLEPGPPVLLNPGGRQSKSQ